MKVRLKKSWGARLPGTMISVSEKRALYLQEQGIGKLMEPLPKNSREEKPQAVEQKPKPRGRQPKE